MAQIQVKAGNTEENLLKKLDNFFIIFIEQQKSWINVTNNEFEINIIKHGYYIH